MINYSKPTPKKWRVRGDAALLVALVVDSMLMTMPISDWEHYEWFKWGVNSFAILFKFYTNTHSDDNSDIN